jgi:hypothetical protein
LGQGFWQKTDRDQGRRGGAGVKNGSGRTTKDPFLRPDPTGGSARLDCPNSPKNFSDAPKGISHALHRVDTDGLGARKRGGRSSFGAGGRRGAAGGLARLLQGWKRMSFQNTSTKEANPEVGRSDHDFTQHSVIRSTKERQRLVPGWKGSPLGKAATRLGTATDYGCCAMAMEKQEA